MTDFKLDAQGNITIDAQGEVVTLDEADEVAQKIQIRLGTRRGELRLHEDFGVRYNDIVLGHSKNLQLIAAEYRNEILKVDDVNKILSYSQEVDAATRTLNVNFTVDTIFGPVTGAVVV